MSLDEIADAIVEQNQSIAACYAAVTACRMPHMEHQALALLVYERLTARHARANQAAYARILEGG